MAGLSFLRRPGGEAGPFLQRYKLSAYPTEANLWAPGGVALILQSARPVQFAAGAFDDIVCANNLSVSRSADTSPYTGEALGWCDAEGEVKLYTDNPSVTAAPCHFSLRLGHGAALICHRHIIHYRAATSLPLTQGSL